MHITINVLLTKPGTQMKHIYLIPFLALAIVGAALSVITTQHESVAFKLENGGTADADTTHN